MEFPANVHIMPLGFEKDRIVETAHQSNADKIILLDWLDDIERPPYHDDVRDELDQSHMDTVEIECNIFDLYETISAVSELIVSETAAGNSVYVNLATGSTITAIGGMIACMLTGSAEPYYVRAETYSTGSEPIAHGVEQKMPIPKYPISKPDAQLIAVLGYLVAAHDSVPDGISYSVRKKDIIEFGEKQGLPFAAHYDGESYNGYYRRLENHILDPLVERGYVDIVSRGRKKIVKPTKLGRKSYTAFQFADDASDDN